MLGSVHHISAKFSNVALFLRFGQPSKQIRHENEAFRKRFTNWRNLEAFRFWTQNILKTELFESALQTGGTWRLFVLVWTENILKTELF